MHFFEQVPLAPPDPILGLTQAYLQDPRPHKVNLGVGFFKDENLKTPLIAAVREAEKILLNTQNNKEYLPIDGDPLYLNEMGALVFGAQVWQERKSRISPFQTLGGTGALKLGGTFLQEEIKSPLWISSPTWPNHRGVFTHCGGLVDSYPYYDFATHQIDFNAMTSFLERLPPRSVVVMHGCCHNPTGIDLTLSQWEKLCELFKTHQLLPFFDLAYQGLGDGLDADSAAVRHFLKHDIEMLVAVSNSKNFSLYSERVGCLFIVSNNPDEGEAIRSRTKQMIRTNYSNPPSHGAKVAALVLNDPLLRASWEEELVQMRLRLRAMRSLLCERLGSKKTNTDFTHLKRGKGMFGFLGLSTKQVHTLITEYGIYMPSDGRINVCGLNLNNIDPVVEAILKVDA